MRSESEMGGKFFKADLHCHSRYSGQVKHLRFLRARDCYSKPIDVYRRAKERGMDLVTITDHDSIDGCLELLNQFGDMPDFIMGEEVTPVCPIFIMKSTSVCTATTKPSTAKSKSCERTPKNSWPIFVRIISFTCSTIFSTISGMRRACANLLSVCQNYSASLKCATARFSASTMHLLWL